MRAFTNLTCLPGHTITIDGESYSCPDFKPGDLQGSVRLVPADRVLAVQWHGDHNHGSIEGFGALEGFSDISQLAPFVSAWLVARLAAKKEKLAAAQRKKAQLDEEMTDTVAAVAGYQDNNSKLDAVRDAEIIRINNRSINALQNQIKLVAQLQADHGDVDTAQAELAVAQAEADADVA